jgi:hypothetical protein
VLARLVDDAQQVVRQGVAELGGLRQPLHGEHDLGVDHRLELRQCRRGRVLAQHRRLVARVGVADPTPQQEAVELRLGQRMRAVVLEWVLRGDHEEGPWQRVGHALHGGGALAHGLEQRRLRLRAGAVDLVCQHDVGEDRPGLEDEATRRHAAAHLGNRGAQQVARQQIARELDAAEARVDGAGDGVGERRLPHAGNVLEQQVTAGDQRLDGAPHHLGLAAQRALDVGAEPVCVAGGLIERERGVVPAAH